MTTTALFRLIRLADGKPRGTAIVSASAVVLLIAVIPPRSTMARAQEGAEQKPAAETPQSAGVEELVKRGNQARREGKVRDAIASYGRARDLAPHTYEIRVLLADTLRRTGDAWLALPEYEAALSINPARYEAYAGKALILRAGYDYEGASAFLREALARVSPASRPDLLLVLAETRRRQKRLDDAGRLFHDVLAARPGDPQAHGGLARVAEDRGDLSGALLEWDRYLEARPGDEAAALRRQELRELKASIEALRQTAENRAARPVLDELGRLQSIAGDAAGAMESFRRALQIAEDDAQARRGLALALLDSGGEGATRAAREFKRLLKTTPGDAVALYNLAALAFAAGDAAGEDRAWQALMTAHPDDLLALRGYFDCLDRQGPEALRRAAGALRSSGGESAPPALLRRQALVLAATGSRPGAAEALYRLLQRDPTDPWSLEVASEILYLDPALLSTLGERVQADLRASAPSPGGMPTLRRVLLARLAWWSGRGEEALILLRQAVAADPGSAVARSALGEAYQAIAHQPDLALAELTRAVELDPSRLAAHVDLALALLRAGRPKRAEAAARRALEGGPGAAPALSVLGAALADQGDFEAAAAAYAAALASDPADNFGLARGQLPRALAALGRNVEARHALRGMIPPIPDLLYGEAWAFARDSYRDRDHNGQDWMAWRAKYRGTIKTEEEAYRAIATMLASLGDPYTRLRDPEESAALFLGRRGGSAGTDPLGRATAQSKTVVSGELTGGLGYIRLTNFTDPNVVAEVRAALQKMRTKEGIVLDLRGNAGGLARSADAIGDLLVGPGKEAGVDAGASGDEPQITGGDGALIDSPLVVLVDGQTGSAAERLARALQSTGRASLAGDPTFGKGKAQVSRVLPGGTTVLVSTSEMLGPDGRPLQGRGLQPSLKARVP